MNKKPYSEILDRIAWDGLTANTDLAPRILARIQKGKRTTMQPRVKMFVTVFLVLLVLVSVLVSVPSVRAAIQRWIGYVPEIGLVSEGQIRMLAEPVSTTREGITLTVQEMWVAPDQTIIQFSVEGWPWGALAANSTGNGCLDAPILRLSDRELTPVQPLSSFGRETGYEIRGTYPAIAPAVNEVTLVMPCLILALPGQAPENWELSLPLIPAPPDMTFPVIEISTPVEATPTVLPQTDANAGLVTDGISLVLDRAVQMDDGYLLYVTLHWENTGLDWIHTPSPETLHVLDASGQEIFYDLDLEATTAAETSAAPGQTAFAIKTAPLQTAGPLTVVIDSVSASMAVDTTFTFDPGPDPKAGEAWELNQDIDVGHGYSLRVLKVTYDLTDGVQAWLNFDMDSEDAITYAGLIDKAHPLTGMTGGGDGTFPDGPFSAGLYYQEPLPEGPLTVTITGISVNLPGHWQAVWTPPQP